MRNEEDSDFNNFIELLKLSLGMGGPSKKERILKPNALIQKEAEDKRLRRRERNLRNSMKGGN